MAFVEAVKEEIWLRECVVFRQGHSCEEVYTGSEGSRSGQALRCLVFCLASTSLQHDSFR